MTAVGQIEVAIERRGPVGIVRFRFAPVNVLSVGSGLLPKLREAMSEALADVEIAGVILHGEGGTFSAGADITDFDDVPERIGELRALFDMVEASPKPVIAAIEGLALGGGLELALAAHYRVASAKARVGFPEISLGILPGGGGTQRAPRLAGAANALALMLDGKPISAGAAEAMGLIDVVTPGDPVSLAQELFASGRFAQPRPTGRLPVPAGLGDAVEGARSRRGLSLAARHIIACVETVGAGDLRNGLRVEAELFGELMASQASRALRHGFFGRRIVARIPGQPKLAGPVIASVTLVGGGLMGTGIAIALLSAGLNVAVVEPRPEAREKARQAIAATFARDVAKGRLAQEAADRRLASLVVVEAVDAAAESDLFIEAVFEDIAVKRQVFEAIDRVARKEAILASNTSSLNLDTIAGFTARPERVVGLHFFSPANIMRLLEVVRGARTSPETLAAAMAFAKAIGKNGVVSGVCDGFIGNRIFEEYLRQAWFLLEEGALPQQVDGALEAFGMAMGPCRVMDLAGQDIGWHIRQRRAAEQPDRPYSQVPDRICELGRFGQKTGAGFYRYPDGRTAEVDPEVSALIEAESARIGLDRRMISDEEIVERCIFAMVNEGARILEEGIAYRPVDIDVVYLDGYGFPAELGGPMFYADCYGLKRLLAVIDGYRGGRHGWAWQPAALLVELAGRDGRFEELNDK